MRTSLYLPEAKRCLLEPAGLDEQALTSLLGRLMHRGVDGGELYFESRFAENWQLDEGIVKSGSYSEDRGVGVRALCCEKTGFAYANDLHPKALERATDTVRAIARSGGEGRVQAFHSARPQALYADADPLRSLAVVEKTALLERIDQQARALDERVVQVMASLGGSHQTVLVAHTDGTLCADVRPLVRLNISVIVESGGRREHGSAGGGGRFDYTTLLTGDTVSRWVREAVEQALLNLEAGPAPAGTMQVVLGPGWPGIMLHEAVGHGLEGDFNRKGASAFSGCIGSRVASAQCTVVDDGTLPGRRGSLSMDDEGTPSACTVLIERGVLKGYMQDKLNAQLMRVAATGNGRRESFAHLPMPRMTNTYMLAGAHDPEEIIRSVRYGVYASQFGGGQVDITNGKFVFSASSARLIENGRLTRPLKGATLTGSGPEVLMRVSMVGSDLQLDEGIGVCGKNGQNVPVGVGQPTLRIDEMTVGGTGST